MFGTTRAFILLLAIFPGIAASQHVDSPGLFHYPSRLTPGDLRWAISVEFAKIPEDIIEEASFVRAPLFKFAARYGLPKNFVLNGQVATQIINNHFLLGAGWVYKHDQLHVQVDYGLAYWFGSLEIEGFDGGVILRSNRTNEEQRTRILQIARRVPGVMSVRDYMK